WGPTGSVSCSVGCYRRHDHRMGTLGVSDCCYAQAVNGVDGLGCSGHPVGYALDIRKPDRSLAVTRSPVIAARRERATRANLGCIRDSAAFVLRRLEEATYESRKPLLDVSDRVLIAAIGGYIRPVAYPSIAPRAPGHERDLRWQITEAQRVVQVEVLKLVRADHRFRALAGFELTLSRHELR